MGNRQVNPLTLTVVLLTVLFHSRTGLAQQPLTTGRTDPNAIRAASPQLRQHAPRSRAPHPLAGVGALVEADVTSVEYYYDESVGPRTVFTLGNIVTHAGNAPDSTTFSQLGGPLPNGGALGVSDLPVLSPGARYIFFFGATKWFYTPIWSGLAFRVEDIGGKKAVLNEHGKPVASFGLEGVAFGTTSFLEPIDPAKPLQPRSAIKRTDANAGSDISAALEVTDFVSAAKSAIRTVGSPLGASSLRATGRSNWRSESTTPVEGN